MVNIMENQGQTSLLPGKTPQKTPGTRHLCGVRRPTFDFAYWAENVEEAAHPRFETTV
jgi:hypothetical protein